jgi:demethylmenaquinone methyltransferase / 2-methoxy-6-polyprenyl-1,4-benzoquinol methylase
MENMAPPSRQEIWKMFDTISPTYDRVNRWMTFGLDLYWRGKMASFLPKEENLLVLDCATGTADQALSLAKKAPHIVKIIGIDLSEEMLLKGSKKLQATSFAHKIELKKASALEIPYESGSFHCVTISFGIRNVVDVGSCLKEILRVLKPGGKVLILETSLPENALLKKAHAIYLQRILPKIGGWISKQKSAYEYLQQTAETFPSGSAFCDLLQEAGFTKATSHPLSLGAVSIYEGQRPL